jgi:regulator of sigma E protease
LIEHREEKRMTFVKILLGLLGLGVVVFIHELGHFLAARWMGIGVEAFSIGWGKPILKKTIRGVEYRLGLFPLGGYCKMKGENEFQAAYEQGRQGVEAEPGSYFAASPLRRIVTCAAGPLFNLIFAALVLSAIWGAGFNIYTMGNRIVLLSDIEGGVHPADQAGLKTGDRIVEIGGKKITYYHDIQENIAVNPERALPLKVERDGEIRELSVRPALDKSTGAGRIGVYDWTEPVVASVAEGSPAALAGLLPGDRILRVNGEDLSYTAGIYRILRDRPGTLELEYLRGGEAARAGMVLSYDEKGDTRTGIAYQGIQYRSPRLSPPAALARGLRETGKTLTVSLRSLGLLFRGIDLTQAVSGPVRITYMAGDIAAAGFSQSFGAGVSSLANFLALISIALGVMNLLPLPILDGGMIVLFLVEGFRRKPLHPRAIQVVQTVGVALIFGLMVFAVFGDIMYLVRR